MKHRIGEVEYQYKGLKLLLINLNTNSGLSSLHLLREQHETLKFSCLTVRLSPDLGKLPQIWGKNIQFFPRSGEMKKQ